MRASDLKPLPSPMAGDLVTDRDLMEDRRRLNDLLAILQEQEERLAALEAGHLRERALESPEAIARLAKRVSDLMGQD